MNTNDSYRARDLATSIVTRQFSLLYWINSSHFDCSFTTNHHHHDSSSSSSDARPVKAYPSFSFYLFFRSSRLCLLHSSSSGRRGSSRIWNRNRYWYVASLCRSFQTKTVDNYFQQTWEQRAHTFSAVYNFLTFICCHLGIHVLGQYFTPSISVPFLTSSDQCPTRRCGRNYCQRSRSPDNTFMGQLHRWRKTVWYHPFNFC